MCQERSEHGLAEQQKHMHDFHLTLGRRKVGSHSEVGFRIT
jgi:hypothetical protein